MTRLAQILIAVLAVVGLGAAAYAVGTATAFDDPPPPREVVVDDVARETTPSPTPSSSPSSAPTGRPTSGSDGVQAVTPSPRQVDDDDRDDDSNDDSGDDDSNDDDGDDGDDD